MFYLAEGSTGLEALGTIFTQIMSWMTSLVTTIVATPLLLIPVGVFCVGEPINCAYNKWEYIGEC